MKYRYLSSQILFCCLQLSLSEQSAAEAKGTILALLLKAAQHNLAIKFHLKLSMLHF